MPALAVLILTPALNIIIRFRKQIGRALARPLLPYILLSGFLVLRILVLPVCSDPVNICNRTVVRAILTFSVSGWFRLRRCCQLVLRLAHFLSAGKSACLTVLASGTAPS